MKLARFHPKVKGPDIRVMSEDLAQALVERALEEAEKSTKSLRRRPRTHEDTDGTEEENSSPCSKKVVFNTD